MDSDKLLVASVLERGKRRRDDDLLESKDELEETPDNGLTVAGELGVEVSVDDGEKTPWEEPPAKLDSDNPHDAAFPCGIRHRDDHSNRAEADVQEGNMYGPGKA